MKLRVEYDELDYISKKIKEDKSSLEKEINNLLASLERLKQDWQGDDVDQFHEKAYNYINRMKVLTDFLDTTSEFISYGNIQYQNQDESFASSLKREVAQNERSGS